MLVDDFDFHLPEARIALRPANPRDSARLLTVTGRDVGTLGDFSFMDLPGRLRRGDVLVVNDTVFAHGGLLPIHGEARWRAEGAGGEGDGPESRGQVAC